MALSLALLLPGKWQSQGREVRCFAANRLEMMLFVSISSRLRSPTVRALGWLGSAKKALAKLQQHVTSQRQGGQVCMENIPAEGLLGKIHLT